MKMNASAWIGIIGGAIGLIVAIGAVVAVGGSSGSYISIGMLALFGGMFFLFYKLFFGPMINNSRLQKNGLPGRARILEIRDTGVTINNNPQVKLTLEVKNSLGQTYTTKCRVLVSRINPNAFQQGMEVPVKIDPKNELNVVIDYSGGVSASSAAVGASASQAAQVDTTALQAELMKMQQENDSLRASGRPARAIIKKYTWLGAYVNGNNPYVELEMEVLPENSSSFSATTKGVIAEASVPKYQPGQEIFVKYDLYDNSKVTIDHS
jgi:hypothetical protein